jgi:hypothetical protein
MVQSGTAQRAFQAADATFHGGVGVSTGSISHHRCADFRTERLTPGGHFEFSEASPRRGKDET